MDAEIFKQAFEKAAQDALIFGRKHITHPIPDELLFNLDPYDAPGGDRPPEGMIKCRDGRFLYEKDLNGIDAATARKLLLVDEKLPEWIHIGAVAADEKFTYMRISYCTSYFTDNDRFLRYRESGNPPFRIWLPNLPGLRASGAPFALPLPDEPPRLSS